MITRVVTRVREDRCKYEEEAEDWELCGHIVP